MAYKDHAMTLIKGKLHDSAHGTGRRKVEYAQKIKHHLNEDAPTNAVGAGNIAGAGGDDPPMPQKRRKKYKEQNIEDTKKVKKGMRRVVGFAEHFRGIR